MVLVIAILRRNVLAVRPYVLVSLVRNLHAIISNLASWPLVVHKFLD